MRDLVKKLRMYPEGIGHSVRLPAADYIEHLEAERDALKAEVEHLREALAKTYTKEGEE